MPIYNPAIIPHASSHEDGGADEFGSDTIELDVLKLTNLYALFHEEFDESALEGNKWASLIDTGGSISLDAAFGGYTRFTTAPTTTYRVGIASFLSIPGTTVLRLSFRRVTFSTTNDYIFAGLMDGNPSAADPPVEPSNGIYFMVANAAAQGNAICKTRAASVETSTDSGTTLDTKHPEVRVVSPAEVRFYIEGILEATHTTNIPSGAVNIRAVILTRVAAAKELYLYRITMIST